MIYDLPISLKIIKLVSKYCRALLSWVGCGVCKFVTDKINSYIELSPKCSNLEFSVAAFRY